MAEDDEFVIRQPERSMVVIRHAVAELENGFSVFPPINHENLDVSSPFDDRADRNREFSPLQSPTPSISSSSSRTASSSSFSLSPSDSDGQPPWPAADLDAKSTPWMISDFSRKSPPTPLDTDGKSLSPRKASAGSTMVAGGVKNGWKLLAGILRPKMVRFASWFSGFNNGAMRGAFMSFYMSLAVAATSVIWWWMRRRRRNKGETVEQLKVIIRAKDEKIVGLLHQIAQMNELLVKQHKTVVASKLSN